MFKYNNEFIEWFVGFVEGDGCLFSSSLSRKQFIITQKDVRVLVFIRNNLKFGTISKQNDNTYRFVVSKKTHINILVNLLNGRIVLNKTFKKLEKFVDDNNINIQPPSLNLINLNSAWLAGFTDAEGCFNIRVVNARLYNKNVFILLKNKNIILDWVASNVTFSNLDVSLRVRFRFILDQKNEESVLKYIVFILGVGKVARRELPTDMFRYSLDSNENQAIVIKYFNKFKLRSHKYLQFLKWKNLWKEVQQKKHLHIKNLRSLKRYLKYKN